MSLSAGMQVTVGVYAPPWHSTWVKIDFQGLSSGCRVEGWVWELVEIYVYVWHWGWVQV